MNNRTDDSVSKTVVLLITTMAAFLTPFMGAAINIALPSIGREFAMDAISLSWVSASYHLTSAMFVLPFGRIADIYGRKKVFTIGIVVFTVASLLAGISSTAFALISARVLQGIGGAMIFGIGAAILTSAFPSNERGRALGINVAAVYLGLSLGPFLGGLLTQHFGWRSIFFVIVPIGLVIVTAILKTIKMDWADARKEKFDFTGSVIYSLGLIGIMYGLSALPKMAGAWSIAIGIIGLFAFVRWEMKVSSPVLSMNLFKHNAVFVFSNLAALINYSATYAVTFLLSLFLQYVKGFNPQNAGLILASMPVVQVILSPVAGRLSDKIEPRILASIGMTLTTSGLALFIFLNENTSMEFIIASLILLGVGFALFSSPNTNAVMSSINKKTLGVASAMLATMRHFGMTLSMGISMLMFATILGRVEISPNYYTVFLESLRIAFVIFTALCFSGIFASFARGKIR